MDNTQYIAVELNPTQMLKVFSERRCEISGNEGNFFPENYGPDKIDISCKLLSQFYRGLLISVYL